MSRLNESKKAVEEAQALIIECLPKLKDASKKFILGTGLCGTAPASTLETSIRKLEYFANLSFQDVIEWQ